MATFTNYATLSYNGGTVVSNTVTGEIQEAVSAVKTAVAGTYSAGDDVTYVISLLNTGAAAVADLTVSDDLGAYSYNGSPVHPLAYVPGSIHYYINGTLQNTPAVTVGPPLTIQGIEIPAGGNAMLVYETEITDFASSAIGSEVTNTATVTGGWLAAPVTASATISSETGTKLDIQKQLSPQTVTENGQITYTFVIENTGNLAADAADNLVISDTFNPILNPIRVTYNGTLWTEGVNYTYTPATGLFSTAAGQITVPAAEYAQRSDGSWEITPGTAVITVTGSV